MLTVPENIMSELEDIREYLIRTDNNDLRFEITSKGIYLQSIETIRVRRFGGKEQ